MDILFRNGRVIDPSQGLDRRADILIAGGCVESIEPGIELGAERRLEVQEIDVAGKWVAPGLVDMHVHLREPGEEYKETIASGTRAAVAGGYTALACMPNTVPVNDCASVTQFILTRAREQGVCRVFPVAAISRGSRGETLTEMAELRDAGAAAVSDDGRPVMNSRLMRHALEYTRPLGMVVISHAEDLSLSRGGSMNEGALATSLGLQGIPAAAEEVMVARDLLLAELTGGRLHIAHVSTAGSVRMIREAKSRGIPVTAETAPHYFTLTEQELTGYDTLFKMNPPLRRPEDVEAVKAGLADGTLDAIATDHAPHSVLEKDTEFELAANGIIGLESAVPLILALVRDGVLDPSQAVAKVSCNPAWILGISAGSLKPASSADLTVIDPEARYVLEVENFRSKSRNCPFHGREVQGRVETTLIRGEIVFSHT